MPSTSMSLEVLKQSIETRGSEFLLGPKAPSEADALRVVALFPHAARPVPESWADRLGMPGTPTFADLVAATVPPPPRPVAPPPPPPPPPTRTDRLLAGLSRFANRWNPNR